MKNRVFKSREAMTTTNGIRTTRRLPPIMAGLLALALFSPSSSIVTARPAQARKQAAPNKAAYVCVMDPEVRSSKPGKCPKCGMRLRRAGDETSAKPAEVADKTAGESDAADAPAQIPDTTVYDQQGRRLRFYSDLVKGKTVAINFIFTTCTTICPPLTATFRKVQQELGDRVGRDVQLISVSVDPVTDVPERLKAFAAKFKAGPGWTFVTGSKPEMAALLKALGANAADKNEHSPMVLVGNDRAAYWTRAYGLAPASTLISVIADAATKTADSATVRVPVPVAQRELRSAKKQVEKRVAVDPAAKDQSPAVGEVKKAKTPAEAAAAY